MDVANFPPRKLHTVWSYKFIASSTEQYESKKLGYHMKLINTNWIPTYDVSQRQSTRINHPEEAQHEPSPHLNGFYAFGVFTSIPSCKPTVWLSRCSVHQFVLHLCLVLVRFGWLFDVGHSSSIAKPEMLFFRFFILFMSLSFCPTFGAPSIKISWYFSWVELLLGLWMVTPCKRRNYKHWSESLPVASLKPELRLDILLDPNITLAYTAT